MIVGIDLLRAEGFHQHADRIGHADRVRQLHFAAIGQSAGDDVLGDVARHVGSRAIDLGRIFSAERAAAVTSHAAVGVDDDLASGESGVAHRSADDKASRGIDVILRVFVEQMRRDDGLNHVLQNSGAQFVVAQRSPHAASR